MRAGRMGGVTRQFPETVHFIKIEIQQKVRVGKQIIANVCVTLFVLITIDGDFFRTLIAY